MAHMQGLVKSRTTHFAQCPFLACQQWSGPDRGSALAAQDDLELHFVEHHGGVEFDD